MSTQSMSANMMTITEEETLKELGKHIDTFELKVDLQKIDEWDSFGDDLKKATMEWYGLKSFKAVKDSYRRVSGVGIDTGRNMNTSFRYSADALRFMVDEFKKNMSKPQLNNFYQDHNMWTIEALMGRVMNLEFKATDKKGEKGLIRFDAVLNKKHPLTARAEMFKSVSMTVLTGNFTCLTCNNRARDCTCETMQEQDIVANKGALIELSYVTFPAYPKASVDKIENFSSHVLDRIKDELKERGMSTPFDKPFDVSEYKAGMDDAFISKFDTPYLSVFADVMETVVENKVSHFTTNNVASNVSSNVSSLVGTSTDAFIDNRDDDDGEDEDEEEDENNNDSSEVEKVMKLISMLEVVDNLSKFDEILAEKK